MQFKNKKGKIIGNLGEDKAYRSRREGSRHILRLMDAWGIDKAVVDTLEHEECTQVRILDEEDGVVYSTSLENFTAHSVQRDFDTPQLFMSRKYWEVTPKEKRV